MQITILLENDHGGLKNHNVKLLPIGEFDPSASLIAMSLDHIADMLMDSVKNQRMAALLTKPGVEIITREEFIKMANSVKLSDVQPYLKQDLAPGPASEG